MDDKIFEISQEDSLMADPRQGDFITSVHQILTFSISLNFFILMQTTQQQSTSSTIVKCRLIPLIVHKSKNFRFFQIKKKYFLPLSLTDSIFEPYNKYSWMNSQVVFDFNNFSNLKISFFIELKVVSKMDQWIKY